jgi:hypothetical protein
MSREAPSLDEVYGVGAESADCEIGLEQQLYAEIKRSSEYAHQADAGELFPVYVSATRGGDYPVIGGPGGLYRLSDVSLWVVEGGKKLRLS